MESLNLNSSVESDGLQFQGFVSQEVLQVSPALMLEPLQFQIGLRIKNTTSAPIRVNLFDTLNCTLVNADGSVTQSPPHRRPLSPSERHFPSILPGETWLDAHRASLWLFAEGYELKWMTRWWRRFLKSVNSELAYSSVRWEIEHPLKLFINRGDGGVLISGLKLGLHQIALTYYNTTALRQSFMIEPLKV